jgi:hypothetical protein
MASQRLKNTLAVTNLAPGASTVLLHGLRTSTFRPLAPDIVFSPNPLLEVTASDATSVTLTNNSLVPLSGTVLVEAWHTLERTFDGVQHADLPVKPYKVFSGSTTDLTFAPGRTVFVAKSWPAGSDPAVYFTSIQTAINQAATLLPTATNPIGIVIFSGQYNEVLTICSNAYLIALSPGSVTVVGNITWTPAVGINAPQATIEERMQFIDITNPGSVFTFDSRGKVSGATVFFAPLACVFQNITAFGRPGGGNDDEIFIYNSNLLNGTYTFTDIQGIIPAIQIISSRFRGLNLIGDTTCVVEGGNNIRPGGGPAPITVQGTATLQLQGLNINNPVNVTSTAPLGLTANGCIFNDTVTAGAGATADIRGSNYRQNSNLIGPGAINRSLWNAAVAGPTVLGANPVVFNPPFPDATYTANLQLTSGPGNAGTTVTGKTGAGFTINEPVGGNAYDYSVTQE